MISRQLLCYHTSLAFWAYAVVSRSSISVRKQPASATHSKPTTADYELVWLDGEDGPDVQRFIAIRRGTPIIHDWSKSSSTEQKERYVALNEIKSVMDIMIAVLRQNGKGDEKISPPLVKTLSQLMRDL